MPFTPKRVTAPDGLLYPIPLPLASEILPSFPCPCPSYQRPLLAEVLDHQQSLVAEPPVVAALLQPLVQDALLRVA